MKFSIRQEGLPAFKQQLAKLLLVGLFDKRGVKDGRFGQIFVWNTRCYYWDFM